ncbi:MAG: tyrosinase family protein [Deltaproteobacteria bacterium]|nr:tyrosinase family protein [Deltaproteobacteria bacterium]
MPIRIRKSIYALEPAQRTALFDAMGVLKANGTWDTLVRIHATAMGRSTLLPGETMDDTMRNSAHRGPAFLPWHRVFLIELEDALNDVAPPGVEIALPYWPWEEDEQLADPTDADVLTDDYLGRNTVCNFGAAGAPGLCRVDTGPAATWDTVRVRFEQVSPGSATLATDADGNSIPVLDADGDPTFVTGGALGDFFRQFSTAAGGLLRWIANQGSLPPQADVDGVLQYTTYDRAPWDESVSGSATTGGFRNRLEGFALEPGEPNGVRLHNVVHVWMGGDMGPGTSPNDPVFFVHHANVDRIWAKWQELRRQVNPSYSDDYRPISGGPTGHNIGDGMFPWNGDPKFPGLASWSPQQTLDTVEDMEFLYDDTPRVRLRTSNLVFGSVIAGETSHRAATFDVVSAYPVRFSVEGFAAGTTGFSRPPGEPNPVQVSTSGPDWDATAHVWFGFEGGSGTGNPLVVDIRATMQMPDGTVAYERVFSVTMSANTIARPSVATALVLDQSGSMAWDAGNGNQRIDVLHFAAPVFVNLLDAGNGLGIVAFDHEAHPRMDVLPMPGAAGTALGIIGAHQANPAGGTSIADGIELARTALDGVAADYDDRAMVVLTDGHETAAKWLDELSSSVLDGKVFAVGLGTAEHIQPERLADIAGSHGGYMLLTGALAADGTDDFLLSKYYLQILAGLTNMQVTLDPEGWVRIGDVEWVPFVVTEADIQADVVLLTTLPFLDMRLVMPDGTVVGPADVGADVQIIAGEGMTAYRVRVSAMAGYAGVWHVVLRLDPERVYAWLRTQVGDPRLSHAKRVTHHVELAQQLSPEIIEALTDVGRNGVHYSVVVHTWSNLHLDVQQHQSGYEPGATATIRAVLSEYGVPIGAGATVQAELLRPDGTRTTIALAQTEPGVFEVHYTLAFAGVWRARVVAQGRDRRHQPFTRERLVTASARRGGDRPTGRPDDRDVGRWLDESRRRWCSTVACLLKDDGVHKLLSRLGLDPERVAKCLQGLCERNPRPTAATMAEALVDSKLAAVLAERFAAVLDRE